MKITLEIPDNILALHIVGVTRADWPNIALYNVSVPSANLFEGSEVSMIKICETKKEK